jgi:hypothetical protein
VTDSTPPPGWRLLAAEAVTRGFVLTSGKPNTRAFRRVLDSLGAPIYRLNRKVQVVVPAEVDAAFVRQRHSTATTPADDIAADLAAARARRR